MTQVIEFEGIKTTYWFCDNEKLHEWSLSEHTWGRPRRGGSPAAERLTLPGWLHATFSGDFGLFRANSLTAWGSSVLSTESVDKSVHSVPGIGKSAYDSTKFSNVDNFCLLRICFYFSNSWSARNVTARWRASNRCEIRPASCEKCISGPVSHWLTTDRASFRQARSRSTTRGNAPGRPPLPALGQYSASVK